MRFVLTLQRREDYHGGGRSVVIDICSTPSFVKITRVPSQRMLGRHTLTSAYHTDM